MVVTYTFLTTFLCLTLVFLASKCEADDILGCGGFVKSHVSLDFSKIEIGLYTKEGSLKERTECAPTNGYYFLPLYEKGKYVLKVHPPPGWSFEPSQVELQVDGVTDQCSTGQDVNFAFNGFGITGRVITAGQAQGPSGISVQLVDDKGERRDTVTSNGGDFHFTPVIPGKYTLKASHPRWTLDPAQAVVQVKEGNTVLPFGVLAVKGYDVKGSVISYGNPIAGIHVLLYSKEENPKYRVEGCNTALLQGVPDSPICHAATDHSGEFSFGLVPAGAYSLLALAARPGDAALSYHIKPDTVPFTVKHDSLYIKNAFEVTGFKVVGSVVTHAGGPGLRGARVLRDGRPVDTTDASGKFTLPALQPAKHQLSFQHDDAEFEDIQLTVTSSGPTHLPVAKVARWRVCGAVTPTDERDVTIASETGASVATVRILPANSGKWCTFLPPGAYNAKVEVSDQEQRDGLQFYPLTRRITVAHGPVSGVAFSQLKARVLGRVRCERRASCRGLLVTLRPLSPDGGYVGQPTQAALDNNGGYAFEEVLPGSVELSVPAERLCWRETRHNVYVTQEQATVPTFEQTGYVVKISSSHDIEVEYASGESRGTLAVPKGASAQCVQRAATYTLTPRGCHRFQPPHETVDTAAQAVNTVHFTATSHAVVVRVLSPVDVQDLVLRINADDQGRRAVGPLTAQKHAEGYSYEHTLYMTHGEVAVVSAESSSLLFDPPAPQQVVGAGDCQPDGVLVRATRGVTVAGQVRPPVPGVTVTLAADDLKLTQVTTSDGKYSFGPLDARRQYAVTAEKESYTFSAPDQHGDITAHKLAEITVQLVDAADGTPLQGALVSVSGGAYRRNAAAGAEGRLRFAALAPAQYYVKPNMKEYRFSPPHAILHVEQGKTHDVILKGVRVAWSCVGRVVSPGGAGWPAAGVLAAPAPHGPAACTAEEATTETNGGFRIRGLLPECVYSLRLKESSSPELFGLKLVKAPASLEVKDNRDIDNVRLIAVQPHHTTDTNVKVYSPTLEHYKSLRLTLALENTPHTPIFSTKLDPTGFSQDMNPGLVYVMPRLPADNKTYVLQLESALSKHTHSHEEQAHYFVSDGAFKFFVFNFEPKVKASEQELRQTSLLVVPLVCALVAAYLQRDALSAHAAQLVARVPRAPRQPHARPDVLDKHSIQQILNTVNATSKKGGKKKTQ